MTPGREIDLRAGEPEQLALPYPGHRRDEVEIALDLASELVVLRPEPRELVDRLDLEETQIRAPLVVRPWPDRSCHGVGLEPAFADRVVEDVREIAARVARRLGGLALREHAGHQRVDVGVA